MSPNDTTPRLKLDQLVSLQELNAVTWNEALAQLDVLVDLHLLGQFVNTPPAGPQDGDAYLTGGAPTGAWSGQAYKIAACLDGAWRFYTPFNGLRAFVAPSNSVIVYCNGVWTAIGSTDFATKSGTETLTNKTLGATLFPNGTIDSSGNIGVNTTAPDTYIEVNDNTGPAIAAPSRGIHVVSADSYMGGLTVDSFGVQPGVFLRVAAGSRSSPAALTAGSGGQMGAVYVSGWNGSAYYLTGYFRYVASESWSSGAGGADLQFVTTTNGTATRSIKLTLQNGGNLLPGGDNTQSLGGASNRWSVVYAGTGTINTSGAATKDNIRPPSDAEIAVAKVLAANVRIFQFREAVAKKGEAGARLHAGMLYEDVVTAFAAQGLDPMRYGIVCRDSAYKTITDTDIVVGEDGSPVEDIVEKSVPDGDASGAQQWVLGLRYDELMQFVIAGLAARLATLEAK